MRPKTDCLLHETNSHHAKDKALRMAARGLAWIGESFIGVSFILLCHARKPESPGDSDARQEGPLLPLHRRGVGHKMREQEIVYECEGCRRLVKLIIKIEGFSRCEDCKDIAEDQRNQFVNYGMN